jgi:hypothetical protein
MWIVFKVIAAIITALITAISWGFITFNIVPNAPWSLIALISFILFAIIVGWGWYTTEKQLKQLEKTRPKITVKPLVLENLFVLKVINEGGGGDFSATAKIEGDKDTYTLCWLENGEIKYHINGKNGMAQLIIAGVENEVDSTGVSKTPNDIPYKFVLKLIRETLKKSTDMR